MTRLEFRTTLDTEADITDAPAEPDAPQAQLSVMALGPFGMGASYWHHRGLLRDASIRLTKFHTVFADQPVDPPSGCMQPLGIGLEDGSFGLRCGAPPSSD
ncbi:MULTISPECIES: hypothetical protein [unclassified Bradyrhizobium]|uniref:hypothetical protein n=1 Tax=unclassified Bradyrhizobium TaxID=2631580 RepID=UPI002916A8D2|nr:MULTISPECIES: hypothetical protein [unclassified Bradyrhizobium]